MTEEQPSSEAPAPDASSVADASAVWARVGGGLAAAGRVVGTHFSYLLHPISWARVFERLG